MGGSVPATESILSGKAGGLCGLKLRKEGWIKENSMDSAKDSAKMLAAINVEGSGFWLLFISQSVNINIPGVTF